MAPFVDLVQRRSWDEDHTVFPAQPIDYTSDGTLYGYSRNRLYASTNHGQTWTYISAAPTTNRPQLRETTDGEALYVGFSGAWKSTGWGTGTVSWAQVVDTVTGTAGTTQFGFGGSGSKFIISQYSVTRADSRYAWISTDSGATWNAQWDSTIDAPSATTSDSHIHGVCYDEWGDRFFVIEGHGDSCGVYMSDDDGVTWGAVDAGGLLFFEGAGTINAPTSIEATEHGIVFGSDNARGGIFVLPRGETVMQWAWRWFEEDAGNVIGFGHGIARDPSNGIIYVGFRSDNEGLPAVIAASDGRAAGLVWEDKDNYGSYNQIAVHNGNVAGYDERNGENIFFNYPGEGGRAVSEAYISQDGTNANFISTQNANLLDADTAHQHQSVGVATEGFLVANAAQSSALTPKFGTSHAQFNPSGAVASTFLYWAGEGTGGIPVSPSTAYTVSFDCGSDQSDMQASGQVSWYDAGGALLGDSTLANVTVGQNDLETRVSTTVTSPVTAAFARPRIAVRAVSGNMAGTDIVYWDRGCFRSGADGTFVPSIRIVGDIDERYRLAPDVWAADQYIASAWTYQTSGYATQLLATTGNFRVWLTGSGGNQARDLEPGTLDDGVPYDLRVTWDVSATTNALSLYVNNVLTDTAYGDATNITPPTANLLVGATSPTGTSNNFVGKIYSYERRDGINGPIVASFYGDEVASHVGLQATASDSYVGDTDGRTWTVTGSALTFGWDELEQQGTDAVMSHLHNLDSPPASLEVVGALNEMNGTDGIGYRKALRTYLNII